MNKIEFNSTYYYRLRDVINDLRNHAKEWEEVTFVREHGESLEDLAQILEDSFMPINIKVVNV